jgi:uncharacterized protein
MSSSLDPTVTVSSSTSSEGSKPEATEAPKPRRPRGFAAMDRKRVSEIASKGGKAAHAAGTAHQFNSDEARAAGHKGGVAPHVRRGRGARTPAPSSKPSTPGTPGSPSTPST